MTDDPDETVVLRPPARRRGPRPLALALALVLVSGAAAWLAFWPASHPALVPAPPPAPLVVPGEAIRTASEAAILAHDPERLTVFRFAPNPRVLVLDFPDLAEQGRMLNRVAALVEKAGLPRDRVLGDAELDAAIRASGTDPATYYYGHDYRAADLVRFFALADRDGVVLTAEEERLRRLLRQEGWVDAQAAGALISIPRTGADPLVDRAARGVILHHELSHGEYFTDPAYAGYVATFWREWMRPEDRAAFRRYLAGEGYDPALEDLIMNEAQAYLMHTRDPRFFDPAVLGIAPDHLAAMQAAFLLGMPPGWLRDGTPGPAATVAAQPVSTQRRRRGSRRRRRRGSLVSASAPYPGPGHSRRPARAATAPPRWRRRGPSGRKRPAPSPGAAAQKADGRRRWP